MLEIVHDKDNHNGTNGDRYVRIEIERFGAVKGIWEKSFKIDRKEP